jgi:hypothetical protein
MTKDGIQKVSLGTNEALRVTADGEFIWHPEADAMIEDGDFTSSPAMRHILRALRKALAAPVQEPVGWWDDKLGFFEEKHFDQLRPLYTTPPAQPAYKDSTPHLHVGNSAFESWFSEYHITNDMIKPKQVARDAYAAGMGDPLVVPAAQPAVPLTDEQREEIAKGWRGRNWTVGDIIDATEAHHGITAAPEKGQP